MRLAVGDVVVYGVHGPGSIVARELKDVLGERQTVVVLALHDGLSVELPLARAAESLRPLADEAALDEVKAVLAGRADDADGSAPWLKRRKEAQPKLTDPVGLAEVIRDAAARSQISPGEREFVRTARRLLEAEIALARGIPAAEAVEWIDEQLARRATRLVGRSADDAAEVRDDGEDSPMRVG